MIIKHNKYNVSHELNANHIVLVEKELDAQKENKVTVELANGSKIIFLGKEADDMYQLWTDVILPKLGGYLN